MIISDSGAKKIESTDNWRDIFADHNGTVEALDQVTADLAPIIKGNICAAGAAAGDYVLLCGSTISGKADGAYIAAKAIPANTALDATYLGTALDGGIANSLNSKITTLQNRTNFKHTTVQIAANGWSDQMLTPFTKYALKSAGSGVHIRNISPRLPSQGYIVVCGVNPSDDTKFYALSNGAAAITFDIIYVS